MKRSAIEKALDHLQKTDPSGLDRLTTVVGKSSGVDDLNGLVAMLADKDVDNNRPLTAAETRIAKIILHSVQNKLDDAPWGVVVYIRPRADGDPQGQVPWVAAFAAPYARKDAKGTINLFSKQIIEQGVEAEGGYVLGVTFGEEHSASITGTLQEAIEQTEPKG